MVFSALKYICSDRIAKQGRKRPLDMPEKKIEIREREKERERERNYASERAL